MYKSDLLRQAQIEVASAYRSLGEAAWRVSMDECNDKDERQAPAWIREMIATATAGLEKALATLRSDLLTK